MCHRLMKSWRLQRATTVLTAVATVVCLVGCGRSNSAASFVPAEDVARQALTDAMTAWTSDGSMSLSRDDGTTVEVVDKHRRPGQSLATFEILGEVSGIGGRSFEVKLELENPSQTEHVRYIVVGINPLWVFRQEDYELLSHWDHPMPSNSPNNPTQKSVSAESAESELSQ
jgi:hypothetical protein